MSPVPVELEMPPGRIYIPMIFAVDLVSITGAVDVITNITPGFVGTIVNTYWIQGQPVVTGGKAATLNWEVGTRNLGGGTIALTSALCTPLGAVIACAAITGSNTFTKTDTISLEASAVTAFAEGSGMVVVIIAVDLL